MVVYKYEGKGSKKLIAYTKIKDESILLNIDKDKPIKWNFCDEINTDLLDFCDKCLKQIENDGYYIKDYKIEVLERTEKISSTNNTSIKYLKKKGNEK